GNRTAKILCQTSVSPENWEEEEEDDDEDEEDDESSDDEDEIDNLNIGLSSMSLVASEDESPDQHYYRISPWGIDIDSESFSWEEYQFMNEKFNPWLQNQKYRHKYKHWFKGPDKECWCKRKLISPEEECNQC